MDLSINLSKEAEATLRTEWGDLELAAKQSLLIESYRTGRISLGFLAETLGVSRCDAEKWLGERSVTWNYGPDDLEADRKTISSLAITNHAPTNT